ncbi:MAG: molybdopterin molybdotransferase MoeA [Thermodesulfobacteriota bacterium]
MINVGKAKKLVIKNSKPLDAISINVIESDGYVLAEDLKSKVDLPLFNNSAMDGFAIKHADSVDAAIKNPLKLQIIATIKAGDSPKIRLKKGGAVKIMTGGMIPKGADAVVRKEDCSETSGYLILKQKIPSGQHIRYKGEEIKKGALGLKKGTAINPAAIGFILELGYKKIKVYRKPKISVLVTGEELLGLDEKLRAGKIRETNSYSLSAAISNQKADLIAVERVKDSFSVIKRKILFLLRQSDILIIAGGVSVGDYDYIKDILLEIKVKKIFWGVSQRPGGPLYFGVYKNKLIFGLPGNPASSLLCFYEYIRPSILKLTGKKEYFLTKIDAILSEDLKKKKGKTHFIRGIVELKNNIYYTSSAGDQGSHILKSFALCNCFIIFPEENTNLKKGEKVEVHLL